MKKGNNYYAFIHSQCVSLRIQCLDLYLNGGFRTSSRIIPWDFHVLGTTTSHLRQDLPQYLKLIMINEILERVRAKNSIGKGKSKKIYLPGSPTNVNKKKGGRGRRNDSIWYEFLMAIFTYTQGKEKCPLIPRVIEIGRFLQFPLINWLHSQGLRKITV